MSTLYKIIGKDRESIHGGRFTWPGLGIWTEEITHPVLCRSGYHLIPASQLSQWLGIGCRVFEAEGRGETVDDGSKSVHAQVRLTTELGQVTRQMLVGLACDFAEQCLVNFESQYPGDDRPRKAIEVARIWVESGAPASAKLRSAAR